jgi:shikimate dehydrogenase
LRSWGGWVRGCDSIRGVKAAVLGSPIAHSLSPALHRAGYAALGLAEWSYGRTELVADQLAGFLASLDAEWRGLSLTMPLKVACLEVADEVTPLAARAGAGNTLVRTPQGWLADNTDIPGLVDALLPAWKGWTRAAVLGAGATARSSVLALESLGVSEVSVYARRPAQASELITWAAQAAPGLQLSAHDLSTWTVGDEPMVVSTLPAGGADVSGLPPRQGLLFDAVYAGWPTPLARAASASGMEVIGGIELLIAQARRQFELFTGQTPPELAMRAAAAAALSQKVVLVGFMGAGKTTVGRQLAARLGMAFVDVDEAVSASQGRGIAQIFAEDGEAGFRALEAATIADLLTGAPAVIALGGGALATEAVRRSLVGQQVILLDISLADALARVGGDEGRPMLTRSDLAEVYAARQDAYRAAATVVVPAVGEVDAVVAAAMRAVRRRG